MPVIRGGDEDGIEVGAGEEFTEVVVRAAVLVLVMGLDCVPGEVEPVGLDVADGADLAILVAEEIVHVADPLGAASNDSEGEAVAGGDGAVGSEGGAGDEGGGEGGDGGAAGGSLEECAAGGGAGKGRHGVMGWVGVRTPRRGGRFARAPSGRCGRGSSGAGGCSVVGRIGDGPSRFGLWRCGLPRV